jgi:predicted nucleic acid-binding protein
VILLDTSVLIDGMTGNRRLLSPITRLLEQGERLILPTIVLYEWLRGPRLPVELAMQEALLPSETAVPFEAADARIGAKLYRSVARARSREVDLAIAACAIRHDAELWTLNHADFAGIPELRLLKRHLS